MPLCLRRENNLLSVHNHRTVPCDPIKDALHLHGTLWELGQITALEILSDSVVEVPEGVTSELRVTRVTEFLDRLLDIPLRKSLALGKVNSKVARNLWRNLRLLIS